MKFRKLERWEHDRTKALYETVFSEDKGAFADYYYTWKTKDNTIYVAEDESGIHAMVHLNPFEVSVCGKVQVLHYIVAVATEESYRHRGLMRNLLNMAMREMAESGEPFTFLMPASEAIYLPFGFRFANWQRQGMLRARPEKDLNDQNKEDGQKVKCAIFRAERGPEEKMYQAECDVKDEAGAEWESGGTCTECRRVCPREDSRNQRGLAARGIRSECRPVRPGEYQALADMANETLAGQADIFIWRNRAYYERLVQEQRCQGGDVMVVLANGKIVGTFCTAREESEDSDEADCCKGESMDQEQNYAFELREIIAVGEFQDLVFVALQSFADENGNCKVYGCPDSLPLAQEERVPLMMTRQLSQGDGEPGEAVPRPGVSLQTSGLSATLEEPGGKERAHLKAAELSGAVIFINEVV